jgi:uncharacterized protein (DUF1778 family)
MILFNIMKKSELKKEKTALLIYCTPEEAAAIREFAKRERRTISGFVMTAVTNRLAVLARVEEAKINTAAKPPNQIDKA